MTIISKDIPKAIRLLTDENVVAIPTETVYGLAGNIYSSKAIKSIFSTKNRPFYNPLIVHIHSITALEDIVTHVPEKAARLASAFWPGSMTLVLPKHNAIPDLITAGKNTVAVRIPNHPLTLDLLSKLPFPLAAPSANPFGSISPTTPKHVEHYFKNEIKQILDGGSCTKGIESTIIGFENEKPVIYRLGALSLEAIEAVVGKVEIKNKKESNPNAPGMLGRHYAPCTKTILSHSILKDLDTYQDNSVGLISFTQTFKHTSINTQINLSAKGNMEEAAANLYNALHTLDHLKLDVIIAENLPNYGLGQSINDRLQRATFTK